MGSQRALALVLALLLTPLAGCLGSDEPVEQTSQVPSTPPNTSSYVPVNASALSQPTHEVGPLITDRVSVTTGDVDIYVEYWLPEDAEGPVPTILHSTPYNHLFDPLYQTSPVTGIEHPKEFWVQRGYAYVIAHVRGFGESEGCVTVWGPEEQADQADLVEWVADQEFSDGRVGMTGVSYPGTTPMEAAVEAPEALDAIVPVAGLTNPYYDWHFGGVPNGESGPVGSPAAYQAIGALLPHDVTHGTDWAESAADSGCQTAPLVTNAYQTDGRYTDFYEERNISARADNVEAPVLYAQGFDDPNVKPSQLLNWFNDLDTEKKGIFGHWGHQSPPREDWRDLTLAWFDEHLKDRDTGVMDGPTVEVLTNLDTWRSDRAFPSQRTERTTVHLDGSDALVFEPTEPGSAELSTDRVEATAKATAYPATSPDRLVFRTEPLEEDLYISGVPRLEMNLTLEGGENAFLQAELNHRDGDSSQEITFGMQNLALRNDVREYEPVPEGEPVDATLRFQPVESIVETGTVLELVIEPVNAFTSDTPEAMAIGSTVTFQTGTEDASQLALPTLDGRPDQPRPDDV